MPVMHSANPPLGMMDDGPSPFFHLVPLVPHLLHPSHKMAPKRMFNPNFVCAFQRIVTPILLVSVFNFSYEFEFGKKGLSSKFFDNQMGTLGNTELDYISIQFS